MNDFLRIKIKNAKLKFQLYQLKIIMTKINIKKLQGNEITDTSNNVEIPSGNISYLENVPNPSEIDPENTQSPESPQSQEIPDNNQSEN